VTTARILEQVVEGYQAALKLNPEDISEAPKSVRLVVKKSVNRSWKNLATERLGDAKPAIPRGAKFWDLSASEQKDLRAFFHSSMVRQMVTSLKSRDDHATIEVLDAAYWMNSSLGLLRIAALIGIGKKKQDFALLDLKEATSAAAPGYKDQKMPKDQAERVVEGTKHLSPFLGNRMAAGKIAGRSVFFRELMPQDLKVEIDQLSVEDAMRAGSVLAGVVGKAHARQMDSETRAGWHKEPERNRSKSLP
jgi:uncharacterized protein (DUF2252 family)